MSGAISEAALAACAREPIHIPGAIQPHGALLALAEPGFVVRQASANAAEFCGAAPDELLGRELSEALPGVHDALRAALGAEDPALHCPVEFEVGGRPLAASVHRSGARLIVELEPAGPSAAVRHHRALQRIFAELRAGGPEAARYAKLARFVAELTGFERVMVYRFDADWNGEVMGEHLAAPVDSYLGHHFPASDIPEQARALYRKSWLRLIPDAAYRPVPLVPALDPETNQPLDLSFAALRSVSPVHLEYLRNMDVVASMSISLIVGGELWGLIACHHREPRVLSPALRAACELLGQVASLDIEAAGEASRLAEQVAATAIQTKFFDVIAREPNVVAALVKYTPELLDFMGAAGAAIHVDGRTTLLGGTPPAEVVAALVPWLEERAPDPVFATPALPAEFPAAAPFRAIASGLLAVKLSRVEPQYVLWFRPEVVTTVTWAGRPDKPLDDDRRLHPRKSFAAWEQTVTGRSRPWSEAERQGARELRQAINALVLRRTERLINLNAELERRNIDLNSFAYIAAHDLKEPLRGIANYCTFMREDHAAELSPEARRKLATMTALVAQSEELLDALNHYARVGRIEVAPKPTDLDALLDGALAGLEALVSRERAEIRRPRRLPTVSCDPVLGREVFSNLVANGIRYNTRPEKWVEIGWEENPAAPGAPVFHVRDNGIGIREKHYDAVFQIFRRLHAHEDFGGGTGAGLAIVKSAVEKHGGRVWIESVYGEGTTFYFTLA